MIGQVLAALALALPPTGIAVETRTSVELVRLDGKIARTLPRWRLTGDFPVAVGTVYLRDAHGHLWLLRGGRLARVARADRAPIAGGCFSTAPRTRICGYPYGRGPSSILVRGRVVPGSRRTHGRWLRVDVSSSGRLLAQWSGECEIPTAFIGPPGGIVPAYPAAYESFALGWAGPWAVLAFPPGGCGRGRGRPGVYVGRRFVHPLHRGEAAVLWR